MCLRLKMTVSDCFSVVRGEIRDMLVQTLIDCNCHYVAVRDTKRFEVIGLLSSYEFETMFRNGWNRDEIDVYQVLTIIDYSQGESAKLEEE
jgi:hypothetical protein